MEDKQSRWLRRAEILDALRVVPRLLLLAYGVFMVYVAAWFMDLSAPVTAHTVFVSTITGVAGIIVSAYTNSGRKWGKD